MTHDWNHPCTIQWCQYLLDSYAHWLGQDLIDRLGTSSQQAERLFQSNFVVASHGRDPDPILNYGNQKALVLWAMDWQHFTQTPSRLTAEAPIREERERMLEQARTQGYISNYRGIRISSAGQRFLVNNAIIWNIHDPNGVTIGQGATFNTWQFLS
ncbi:MAG TPA: MEKHLA domain-containing protein [Nitrosomonas sp.]|nr:MEKHLA domain-containing protein [Nitrosomonas sp.]